MAYVSQVPARDPVLDWRAAGFVRGHADRSRSAARADCNRAAGAIAPTAGLVFADGCLALGDGGADFDP